jgi:hypothetical protein
MSNVGDPGVMSAAVVDAFRGQSCRLFGGG